MFHVAGKYYVPEEGYGYERLYKVDYGATFQGVTTVLFGYFLAFANFKTFKEPSADNYKYLTAASVVSALLFMQMAVRACVRARPVGAPGAPTKNAPLPIVPPRGRQSPCCRAPGVWGWSGAA